MVLGLAVNSPDVNALLALADRRRAYNVVRVGFDPFADNFSPLTDDEATFDTAVGWVELRNATNDARWELLTADVVDGAVVVKAA